MSPAFENIVAIGIAIGCGIWLVRAAIARLARPGCGDPGRTRETAFVSSESLAQSRPKNRRNAAPNTPKVL